MFLFPRLKKIIFIHGCFWHMHTCKYGRVAPKTNADFWQTKRLANKQRDKKNLRALKSLGWDVLVIWQCQTRDQNRLTARLKNFLSRPRVIPSVSLSRVYRGMRNLLIQ